MPKTDHAGDRGAGRKVKGVHVLEFATFGSLDELFYEINGCVCECGPADHRRIESEKEASQGSGDRYPDDKSHICSSHLFIARACHFPSLALMIGGLTACNLLMGFPLSCKNNSHAGHDPFFLWFLEEYLFGYDNRSETSNTLYWVLEYLRPSLP